MNEEIYNIIRQLSPIKRKDLLDVLKLVHPDLTDRQMRKEINQMITTDGYCIQSSNLGYSVIRNIDDLKNAMEYLKAKSKPIAIRANCLLHNFNRKFQANEQITMDLI